MVFKNVFLITCWRPYLCRDIQTDTSRIYWSSGNGKLCRSCSNCFLSRVWQYLLTKYLRSSLIWVCTVCICHFVRNFGVQIFRTFTVIGDIFLIFPRKQGFNISCKLFPNEVVCPRSTFFTQTCLSECFGWIWGFNLSPPVAKFVFLSIHIIIHVYLIISPT